MPKSRIVLPRAILFAVSQSSDPTAGWYTYMFPSNEFLDFPILGVNNDKVVITISILATETSRLLVLNKANVLSGASVTPTTLHYYWPYGTGPVTPALTHDANADLYPVDRRS